MIKIIKNIKEIKKININNLKKSFFKFNIFGLIYFKFWIVKQYIKELNQDLCENLVNKIKTNII